MMVKTKPNQKIHVDKLQTTGEKLENLKEKPKEELTLRESICFLKDKLNSTLKKGYSYQDLSEILAEQEILISAATLKQYLTEINKQSASRKKRSKSGQSKKNNSSSDESSLTTSSKNVTKSKEESNQKLNQVESDKIEAEKLSKNTDFPDSSEVKLSLNEGQKELSKSQSKNKKSVRVKPKELSGSNQDLSQEFNQY